MIFSDILIVGAGISGVSLARELSRFNASVAVLDRACDVAEGATKANSGIIHAGYDAVPGTLKAIYNVRGSRLYASLCSQLSVPYRKCGALVIGFEEADRDVLRMLLDRGKRNGVEHLSLLSREEALSLEPSLNADILCALSVPESAIVSPYEMAFALADDASLNGVSFYFDQEVHSISYGGNGLWQVQTPLELFTCRALINCAGASGASLHNMVSSQPLSMVHRRGQYYLLDHATHQPFSRTIFQCPSKMGKGVLVSPTVHDNLLLGPTAEDIQDPLDTSTTAEGLADILRRASRTWPGLSVRSNITNYSGVRAHLDSDDFVVGPVSGVPGVFEAIGIESPGLSAAPAVAQDLSAMVASFLSLSRKSSIIPYPVVPKPFHEMSDEERAEAVRSDPAYGRIVCRCEVITEAEILRAIRRPVGARTIDGIKRRTRAGMGRCQGGFCSPRVAQILAEEMNIPLLDVTKDGGNSFLLSGTVEAFLKGGNCDD